MPFNSAADNLPAPGISRSMMYLGMVCSFPAWSTDDPASGKNNFSVSQPFAPALNHNRVTDRHECDHLVLRRAADEPLSVLNGVDALVIIRIIEPQDHAHEFLRRLQNDLVLAAKQFCLKPLNH